MLTDHFVRVSLLGAEWVMWVLILLSFASIALMVERAMYFAARRLKIETFSEELYTALRRGDVRAARELAQQFRAPECLVVDAGLHEYPHGVTAVSEAMLSAKARAKIEMERYLGILGTLGNNAPFIGLFGTVLGIIKASHDMTAAPATEQAAAPAVMAGVFEALVATAVGLFVAIPAVIAYNYFQRQVRTRLGQIDSLAHLVLSVVRPVPPKPPPVPSAAAKTTPKMPR